MGNGHLFLDEPPRFRWRGKGRSNRGYGARDEQHKGYDVGPVSVIGELEGFRNSLLRRGWLGR